KMVMKKGRYGSFLACSNYPECKYIKSNKVKEEPVPTGEMCPECGHELVQRKSRFGTTFVGCSNYPKCRYIKKDPKKESEAKEKKKKTTTKKTTKKVVKKKVVKSEAE
ncbi:MAG: topoisomerase DNA-binding C4 zinc finger domain-containing protein, partial [Longicatena sp.]